MAVSLRRDLGLPEVPPTGTILVHYFKPSGKWYTSEDVAYVHSDSVHDAFSESVRQHGRLRDMIAVCLEFPDHPHDHLMLRFPEVPV